MSTIGKNPFLYTSGVETIKVTKTYSLVGPDNNGTLVGEKNLKTFFISKYQKVSLYKTPQLLNILMSLNKSGIQILFYLISKKIKKEVDFIKILPSEHIEMGVSQSSFYRGVKELVELNVLAKKSVKEYWINPHIIFSGNREKALTQSYGEDAMDIVMHHTS